MFYALHGIRMCGRIKNGVVLFLIIWESYCCILRSFALRYCIKPTSASPFFTRLVHVCACVLCLNGNNKNSHNLIIDLLTAIFLRATSDLVSLYLFLEQLHAFLKGWELTVRPAGRKRSTQARGMMKQSLDRPATTSSMPGLPGSSPYVELDGGWWGPGIPIPLLLLTTPLGRPPALVAVHTTGFPDPAPKLT